MTDFFPAQKLSVSGMLWFHIWQQIVTRVCTFTCCESIVNYVCISLFSTTQHCASKAQLVLGEKWFCCFWYFQVDQGYRCNHWRRYGWSKHSRLLNMDPPSGGSRYLQPQVRNGSRKIRRFILSSYLLSDYLYYRYIYLLPLFP